MIGDPETATTTLTYVPGTTVNLDSFYSGGAQAIPQWFVANDGGGESTVAFVYMDGPGPTWPGVSWSHANTDPAYASAFGQRLAEFQHSLNIASPDLADSYKVGAGHSAGETGLSASEQYGAHYDYHASLAGAWQLWDWVPDPDTKYAHYSYGMDALDPLSDRAWRGGVQNVPVIGPYITLLTGGSIESPVQMPTDSDAFETFNFDGSWWPITNHNQASAGDIENQPLLNRLLQEVDKHRG